MSKDEAARSQSVPESSHTHSVPKPSQHLCNRAGDIRLSCSNDSEAVKTSAFQTQVLTPPTSTGVASTRPASPRSLMTSTCDPSPQDAQDQLNFFRENMLCLLPFMIIPPSKTASGAEPRSEN
ncbi:MAG: hypothetical protein Q9191_001154 [Dirinaria sp. TL-2023a]